MTAKPIAVSPANMCADCCDEITYTNRDLDDPGRCRLHAEEHRELLWKEAEERRAEALADKRAVAEERRAERGEKFDSGALPQITLH